MLDIDLRLTVSALATMAYASIWTGFMILTEYLHMSNVYAPRMLKDSDSQTCLEIAFKTLSNYPKECALSMMQSGVPIEQSYSSKQPITSYDSTHTVKS